MAQGAGADATTVSTVAVLFALAVVLWAIADSEARARDARWLPAELRQATLVYSEHTFVTTQPFLLGAVVDRVYRRPDGVLVLIEFKQRDQATVFQYDVVELSAQRLALVGATRAQVAEHGYVAVASATGLPRVAVRIALLPCDQVEQIRDRYLGLVRGEVNATRANRPGLCVRCPYSSVCNAEHA